MPQVVLPVNTILSAWKAKKEASGGTTPFSGGCCGGSEPTEGTTIVLVKDPGDGSLPSDSNGCCNLGRIVITDTDDLLAKLDVKMAARQRSYEQTLTNILDGLPEGVPVVVTVDLIVLPQEISMFKDGTFILTLLSQDVTHTDSGS